MRWVWHEDIDEFKELNLLGEVESQCSHNHIPPGIFLLPRCAGTLKASAGYERAYCQVPKPDPGQGKLYKSSSLFFVSWAV